MICLDVLFQIAFICVHVCGLKAVSFFFYVCGQRMSMTLSSLKEKVNAARCPLPLFTCLHVKPDVSELMFAGMSHQSQHPPKWRFLMILFTDKVAVNFSC